MVEETRKILGLPGLRVAATCVRVPVFVGHAEAIFAEFDGPITPEAARLALEAAPGLVVHGDPTRYPTSVDVAGQDAVHVGRIRRDDSVDHGLCLWVVADNLRKGAATNAVQIAEILVEKNLLRRTAH